MDGIIQGVKMMIINKIKKSYINISGEIYDSEFINLANVKKNRILLDEKTFFLTDEKKSFLNSQQIKKFDDVIYIFEYKNISGIVCDVPISEYKNGKIKCHESVIPDVIQGMLSNLHDYNCEVAPILLTHEKKIDYLAYIKEKKYIDSFDFGEIKIYVLSGEEIRKISDEFTDVEYLYVADGHHRLYTTSLSGFKNSVLSCIVSFDDIDILPIHRVIPNVQADVFEKTMKFICRRFEVLPPETPVTKGRIFIKYNEQGFVVNLIELNSDAFRNNDIYRLNTQIISQAFHIFDTGTLKYVPNIELEEYKNKLKKTDVLIQTYPVERKEFIECATNNYILPPKTTCFFPKFPSFLIFKQYK